MKSRRPLRYVLILFSLLLLAGGSWWVLHRIRDFQQRQQLFASCHSDKLCVLAARLKACAQAHDGRFPGSDQFPAIVTEQDGPWFLSCFSGQPYRINAQLAEIPLNSGQRRALVWCPPGSHGRYVGVVVVAQGNVSAEIVTISELEMLMSVEQVHQSTK